MKPHPRLLVLTFHANRWAHYVLRVALVAAAVEAFRGGLSCLGAWLGLVLAQDGIASLGRVLSRAQAMREVEVFKARFTHAMDQMAAHARESGEA